MTAIIATCGVSTAAPVQPGAHCSSRLSDDDRQKGMNCNFINITFWEISMGVINDVVCCTKRLDDRKMEVSMWWCMDCRLVELGDSDTLHSKTDWSYSQFALRAFWRRLFFHGLWKDFFLRNYWCLLTYIDVLFIYLVISWQQVWKDWKDFIIYKIRFKQVSLFNNETLNI